MKARPKPKPWVTNKLTPKKQVSPDIDWLINRLADLNPLAKDRQDVADHHAHQVYGFLLTWRWRGDITGVEIRGTQRPYAKRVAAKGSVMKELKRLLAVARGQSDRRFQTAWLDLSGRTLSLIGWRPHGSGGFEISLRGFRAVAPTRADALPLIEAALRKHEAMSATERRNRQGDVLADAVCRAVAVAYHDLTGKRGLYWDDARGRYRGGLLDLARDIEICFECVGLLSGYRLERFS